ncbi:hypothetical protein HZH66_007600 [Vespula vulgaris]|uniref:Uncharacterized protein n=2 Tax=Vespula TaxID=7451 RepID=A0A834N719_VESVU|nr:hypothetical protein HZH66_007600 [Vespula vulgaris]
MRFENDTTKKHRPRYCVLCHGHYIIPYPSMRTEHVPSVLNATKCSIPYARVDTLYAGRISQSMRCIPCSGVLGWNNNLLALKSQSVLALDDYFMKIWTIRDWNSTSQGQKYSGRTKSGNHWTLDVGKIDSDHNTCVSRSGDLYVSTCE